MRPLSTVHLAVERRRQPVRDRAFDLRGDLVGIDRVAAVERQHHAVHLHRAFRPDRHLGDRGRVAAVAHELRDAAMHARAAAACPSRPSRRPRSSTARCFGCFCHQRAAELERVLARRARGLVDEALHVHAVLVRVDAAPRPDRHVRVAHRVLDAAGSAPCSRAARRRASRSSPAAGGRPCRPATAAWFRNALIDWPDTRTCKRDEVARSRRGPARQPALRDRAVEVVRHVLLAAPDHLDRHAGELLRDRDRLAHVVLRAAAAAEAAAERVLVDLALLERQAGFLGRAPRARPRRSASAPTPRRGRP